jgi:hypothetical protein
MPQPGVATVLPLVRSRSQGARTDIRMAALDSGVLSLANYRSPLPCVSAALRSEDE